MVKREKEDVAFLVYVILLIAAYWLHGPGLEHGSPVWVRLTYGFSHGNIFHLLANVYCLLLLCYRMNQSVLSLVLSYIISVSVPVVWPGVALGASGVCYALMGWNIPYVANKMFYLISLGVFLVAGCFFPGCAWFIHTYCTVAGFLMSLLCRRVLS